MSVPPIDSPVASFEVRCRVGQFVMDSDDPDRAPDLVPVGGTVTVEPDLRRPIRVQGETGPRVVGVDPLEFTIDPATGKLIHPDGEPGVELIDPTDPHLDPQGWTYTARIRPEKGRSWDVTFGAPADDSGIVDLGSVVTVAPSPGVTENYLQQTITARDSAESFAVRAETAATEAEDWAPSFTWDGTRLVIDGETGPDLQGPAVGGIGDVPGLQAVLDALSEQTRTTGNILVATSTFPGVAGGSIQVERVGPIIYMNIRSLQVDEGVTELQAVLPAWARPGVTLDLPMAQPSPSFAAGPMRVYSNGNIRFYNVTGSYLVGLSSWTVEHPFPDL